MNWTLLFFLCSGVQASSANPAEILRAVQQLIEQGEFGNARERLLRALKQYPAEPNFHNLLGVVEAQQGNYVSAESSFLQAIKLAPKSPGTYLNLGRLYQENSAK